MLNTVFNMCVLLLDFQAKKALTPQPAMPLEASFHLSISNLGKE